MSVYSKPCEENTPASGSHTSDEAFFKMYKVEIKKTSVYLFAYSTINSTWKSTDLRIEPRHSSTLDKLC